MTVRLAFVTYETPYAPCGGIAAVMGRLPRQIEKASGLSVVVITPFHHRIAKTASLAMEPVGSFRVPHGGAALQADLLRYEEGVSWIFLRVGDPRFFAGRRHPYDVASSPGETGAALLRDSLLFGAAAARALEVMDPEARWVLLLQDWEAATLALALAGTGSRHLCYLTLHNSYDSPASNWDLLLAGLNPDACPGQTVLDRALARVEWPIFTVSEPFSLELTEDLLQAEILAPHLRDRLRPRLVGVNNGPFADLAVPETVAAEAACGKIESFVEWKEAGRREFLKALDALAAGGPGPIWGDPCRFRRDRAPWFVLAGRDDARQKGYDVAVEAAASVLEQGAEARFLFFPIPGDEGIDGLGFVKDLAERFPEKVLAMPFLFREGYFAALRGAAFGVMPSLYEPFGMANEFYLNGAAGIGRATGGILLQIVPLRAAASFSQAVEARSSRWHAPSAAPTGILYREPDDLPDALEDWRAITQDSCQGGLRAASRPVRRRALGLFRAMAWELEIALFDGIRLFVQAPDLYFSMLAEGIRHIRRTLSWERTAQEYLRRIEIRPS